MLQAGPPGLGILHGEMAACGRQDQRLHMVERKPGHPKGKLAGHDFIFNGRMSSTLCQPSPSAALLSASLISYIFTPNYSLISDKVAWFGQHFLPRMPCLWPCFLQPPEKETEWSFIFLPCLRSIFSTPFHELSLERPLGMF